MPEVDSSLRFSPLDLLKTPRSVKIRTPLDRKRKERNMNGESVNLVCFHPSFLFEVLMPQFPFIELEIEQEEREAQEQAKKQKADMDRLFGAQERAFQVL
jgi:hypothetical protein